MKSSRQLPTLPELPEDFGYSADHELTQKTARRFLAQRSSIDELRRDAPKAGFEQKLYSDLCELGWVGLTAAAELGGAGLDHLHAALLFEEMGRTLLRSPFLGSWLCLSALELGGDFAARGALCEKLISGELVGSVALDQANAWQPGKLGVRAERRAGGYELCGLAQHVAFGAAAGLLIIPAELEGEAGLFRLSLPHKGAQVASEKCVDETRPTARIELDALQLPAEARLPAGDALALRRLSTRATLMLAAEMLGGAEAVLLMTRDYAAERQQFGKAIGAFQAVKHPIVNIMIGVELARSLVYAGAAALSSDPENAEIVAQMAKALVSDVYADAVRRGVQLHGGFGFTIDCNVHFYFKRALASRALLGDATELHELLGDQLFAPA